MRRSPAQVIKQNFSKSLRVWEGWQSPAVCGAVARGMRQWAPAGQLPSHVPISVHSRLVSCHAHPFELCPGLTGHIPRSLLICADAIGLLTLWPPALGPLLSQIRQPFRLQQLCPSWIVLKAPHHRMVVRRVRPTSSPVDAASRCGQDCQGLAALALQVPI